MPVEVHYCHMFQAIIVFPDSANDTCHRGMTQHPLPISEAPVSSLGFCVRGFGKQMDNCTFAGCRNIAYGVRIGCSFLHGAESQKLDQQFAGNTRSNRPCLLSEVSAGAVELVLKQRFQSLNIADDDFGGVVLMRII